MPQYGIIEELDIKRETPAEQRKRVVDYIYTDLRRRSLDTILADIVMDPESYKQKALGNKKD